MTLIQILFLSLLIVFYGAYITKTLLLGRQGVRVNIPGKGNKPPKALFIEKFLRAATLAGAAVQFFSVLFPNAIWTLKAYPTMREDGLILAVLGTIFFIAAVMAMGKNWRAGFTDEQGTELVTGGIYRFSRNPAFLAFDLLYTGCALAFPNPVNIAAAILAIILFHMQIAREEKFCAEVFGQAYADYKNTVMKYFGRKKI